MSENFYYDDVKVIKKPIRKRIKRLLIFFIIFLSLGGIVVSAMYISKSLTVSNITSIFVYGGTDIKLKERQMYAVSVGSYDTREEADKVAIGATIQGAGGLLWEEGNKYYVLGSIYSDLSSAEKVVENLKDTKYSVSILSINLPKVNLSFDEYENKQVAIISDAINYFETVYSSIYGYSISFDRGEMNNLAISTMLSSIRGEVKGYISNLQSILSMPNAKVQEVQKSLIKLDELLDQAIIKTIDNSSTAAYLKYSLCAVIGLEYDMRQNLA